MDLPADRRLAWPPGSFVARLDDAARDALLELGRAREFAAWEALLREGEQTGQVFLLISGWVKVSAVTAAGREVLLAIRVQGDIVGELAALDVQPRSATVTACGRVLAREIGADQFRELLNRWPAIATTVAMTVGGKLRTATRRRVELSGFNVRDRVIRVLAELSRNYGQDTPGGRVIGIKLSQPELAAAVGASETSVHNALRELRAQELVATAYRRVTILRPDRFDDLAR